VLRQGNTDALPCLVPSTSATRRLRIFVSSPSDVDERNQYAAVVQELNLTLGALLPERAVVLELVRWETHTHPDLVAEPQRVVDEQIEADYDIFVGIMWTRFGTPTSTAKSGTEHEFRLARRLWQERRRPAHLLFYFCDAPIPAQLARESADQLGKVHVFRTELEQMGLIGRYESRSEFGNQARRDLIRVVGRLLHPDQSAAEMAERVAQRAPDSDLRVIREQVAELAREYDAIRSSMNSGSERTRRMEVIASRMRTLAPSAFALLPELMGSSDPGKRLAAICALQVVPDGHHVDWLAERMSPEMPFVQYHAAVALLAAVRELGFDELAWVDAALTRAETDAAHLSRDTDRSRTLQMARADLHARRRLDSARPRS
jgi:hypothetical protein